MISMRKIMIWNLVKHVRRSNHFWHNNWRGIAHYYTQDIQDPAKLTLHLDDFQSQYLLIFCETVHDNPLIFSYVVRMLRSRLSNQF